jgi:hypothetical protein
MFGHAGGDVSVVMLDRDATLGRKLHRELATEIAGMKIVRDDTRLDMKESGHAVEGLLEELKCLVIFEIPEVLTEEAEARPGEAERAFLLRSAGEHLGFSAA